jgi:hypothetical protein
MDMDALVILPVLLASAGAVISGLKTLTKAFTRQELTLSVQKNAADSHTLKTHLEAGDLIGAEAVVRKHIAGLSPAEQREANEALAQPSSAGRARYIRELVARLG